MTTRRITQTLAEIEYLDGDPARRLTQALAEIEYIATNPARRLTQVVVEIEYVPGVVPPTTSGNRMIGLALFRSPIGI